MNCPRWIEKYSERTEQSIYRPSLTPDERTALLIDVTAATPSKFAVVHAAFAQLNFPLRLVHLRSIVPESFWHQHCRISYVGCFTGFVPIYFGDREWFYTLRFIPTDVHSLFAVYFVAAGKILPNADLDYGDFDPPAELQISRFTLAHPFLRYELHEPDGIRLFKHT